MAYDGTNFGEHLASMDRGNATDVSTRSTFVKCGGCGLPIDASTGRLLCLMCVDVAQVKPPKPRSWSDGTFTSNGSKING
jgi:hypothetical protein